MDGWMLSDGHADRLAPPRGLQVPTLIGAVGVGLVAVVPAVIVPVAGPVLWDAAPAVAFKLGAGARVAAACLVTIVPTVIVWGGRGRGAGKKGRGKERVSKQPSL